MAQCPNCKFTFDLASRSLQQNRAYWDLSIEPAAEYCGVKPMEFHEDMKREFFEREIPFNTKDGVVFKKVSTGTTTTMTTKQFADYWTWVNRRIFEICGFYPQEPNQPPVEAERNEAIV